MDRSSRRHCCPWPCREAGPSGPRRPAGSTSLPSVAPTISPVERSTSTTSGSGLFHSDIGWMPTSAPQPTADIGCALVKISASGPIPTSRYCDQRFMSCNSALTRAACSEPATTPRRLSPRTGARRLRMSRARVASPFACSSMTRSSILSAKVTPAALIACRSVGASRLPVSPERKASSGPRSRKFAVSRNRPTRPSISSSADIVAARGVRSSTWPPEMRTGQGPPVASDQTRPTSDALAACSGRIVSARSARSRLNCIPPGVSRQCGPPARLALLSGCLTTLLAAFLV